MASVTTESPTTESPARAPRSWFRGDVDGVRAIAILLVVGYHANWPLFGGGFIGVDVFFVISGFLISRNLLRESETTDRIGLGGFWSRRIRRLVPALTLMVLVTLVASMILLPPYDLAATARQGGSAVLYVSNLLFAVDAQNYFAAEVSTSPFLHTWSLGVEEQFYLVWPLVFAAACWSQRRRLSAFSVPRRRRILALVFGLTLVVSLALSVALTASGSSWAFFGLPSRAWEFGVAGLLAVLPVPAVLRHVGARTAMAVVGLAVLATGVLVIDDATAYPGLWALIPVTATVLIIVAGETWDGSEGTTVVSRMLSVPPAQWLGRVSYSWYLWHWPAIVLLVVAVDDDGRKVKTAAAAGSLVIAWLAYRFFETPLRFTPLIARSHRRTYLAGAVATGAVLVVAGALYAGTAPPASDPSGLQAAAGSSLEDRVSFGVDLYRSRVASTCPTAGATETVDGDRYCTGGDPDGTRTLMLIGDSHAGQWRDVLETETRSRGIKLLVRQHAGCPPIKVRFADGAGLRVPEKEQVCLEQQEGNLRVVDRLRPDAVVVASWAGYSTRLIDDSGAVAERPDRIRRWHDGVETFVGELQRRDIEVGWIVDAPTLPFDPSKCLVAKGDVDACTPDRATALEPTGGVLDAERAVLAERGVDDTVDLTERICDADTCALESGDTLVYVDTHHLTDAYVETLREQIRTLVDGLAGP